MKKKQLLLAPALAMLLVVGACSNEENQPQAVDLNTPISLDFGMETATKVAIANPTGFDAGDRLGVYLATSDDNAQAPLGSGRAVNNVPFSKTATGWDGAIYWQNTSQWHTLYGYYPYDETLDGTLTSKAVTVAQDQQADGGKGYKATDCLWGVNAPTKATTNTQTMVLNHCMARVTITLKPGKDITDAELDAMAESLRILASNGRPVPATGMFELATGVITANAQQDAPLTEVAPYYTNANGSRTYYAILLPGTGFTKGEPFISLTATDGTTYVYKLDTSSDLSLEAGKEYIFNLTANKAGLNIEQFNIADWTTGGSSSGNIDIIIP